MGANVDRVYQSMDVVAEMPGRAMILDMPCGIEMLRLRADQRVRYVGLDISAPMLQRARSRVPAEHRDRVEIIEGSIERMPFEGGEFDLFVLQRHALRTRSGNRGG
nr:class I SAM-dependent methyltransferase [Mycolicibacterium komossense]